MFHFLELITVGPVLSLLKELSSKILSLPIIQLCLGDGELRPVGAGGLGDGGLKVDQSY